MTKFGAGYLLSQAVWGLGKLLFLLTESYEMIDDEDLREDIREIEQAIVLIETRLKTIVGKCKEEVEQEDVQQR